MTASASGGPDNTLGGILTCTSLPDPAHELLGLLTTTAKRRKHALMVMTNPTDWAYALGWEPELARTWRDDLLDWGYLHDAEGRLTLNCACTCQVSGPEELTDSSIPHPVSATKLTSSTRATTRATRVGSAPYLGEGAEHTPPAFHAVKSNPQISSLDTKSVAKWSARDLACYFNKALAREAHLAKIQLGPEDYVLGPLVQQIARWSREGTVLGPETVKGMIDRFLSHLGEYTAEGQPAWKAFLARRQHLWHAETEAAKRDLSRDSNVLMAEREAYLRKTQSDRPTIDQMMAEREAWLAQGAR